MNNGAKDTKDQWIVEKSAEILRKRRVVQNQYKKILLTIVEKSTDKKYADDALRFVDEISDCELSVEHILNMLTELFQRSIIDIERTYR